MSLFLTSGEAVVTTFFHEWGFFFYPPSKYCFVPVDLQMPLYSFKERKN